MPNEPKQSSESEPSGSPLSGLPKEITQLLEKESDRGAILIIAAYLEEILTEIVKANCVSDKEANSILDFRRPAGDFDSKICLCNAFALISTDEGRALNYVRRIRNQAAHFDRKGGRGFNVLFDSPQTIDLVAAFAKVLNQEITTREPKNVRRVFTLLGRILAFRLYVRLIESQRPQPLKSLKEIANAWREQHKNTSHGRQIAEAEELARKGNPENLFKILQNTMDALKTAAQRAIQSQQIKS